MKYIEALEEFAGPAPAVFLAGGISDAENWQARVVTALRGTSVTLLNPRRRSFPTGDALEMNRQIDWEYRHLSHAALCAFWFPPQTMCPIAMFELGARSSGGKPLLVGTDRNFARGFDVKAQLGLRRPDVAVVDRLEDLIEQIVAHPVVQES